MLLVKHYYPGEWGLGVPSGSLDGCNEFEQRLSDERNRCRIVAEFSELEEKAFHIL